MSWIVSSVTQDELDRQLVDVVERLRVAGYGVTADWPRRLVLGGGVVSLHTAPRSVRADIQILTQLADIARARGCYDAYERMLAPIITR